jgi:hypothetical protein
MKTHSYRRLTVALALLSATGLFGLDRFLHAAWAGEESPYVCKPPVVVQRGPGESRHKDGQHPLAPALRQAEDALTRLEKTDSYSAILVKRERIGGTIGDYQHLSIKIRHKPFSVYIRFLCPSSIEGREVLYVAGKNDGNMLVHEAGVKGNLLGTLSLAPGGYLAMQGQHYSLKEIGMLNLTRRLVEVAKKDSKFGECEVKFFPDAKVDDRPCTCIQVVHPKPRRNFLFHLARIFVDDKLKLPIRYEAHDWPKTPGGDPELIEEYTYLRLKLQRGFKDDDFSAQNSEYHFQ